MSATVPDLLRQAHRLRKHLRELQSEVDLGPRVSKAQQAHLAAEEQVHKTAYELVSKLKLKIREDEVTLKQLNTQLEKFEKQINEAGSPKEYEGKQSEIRQAKEKIALTEEAILMGMEELENRTARLPADDTRWADAQANFKQQQVDAKERLERIVEDQGLAKDHLAKADAQLPTDVKHQYDRLITRYGPDGLAGVNGRSCQQCRTAITEQQKAELVNGKFICCPNCGRGLYVAG